MTIGDSSHSSLCPSWAEESIDEQLSQSPESKSGIIGERLGETWTIGTAQRRDENTARRPEIRGLAKPHSFDVQLYSSNEKDGRRSRLTDNRG